MGCPTQLMPISMPWTTKNAENVFLIEIPEVVNFENSVEASKLPKCSIMHDRKSGKAEECLPTLCPVRGSS